MVTWLGATPSVIRAISKAPLYRAVAFWRTAAVVHHIAIFWKAHVGHGRHRFGKADAVGREDLGEEVDVAAKIEHAAVVARDHRFLLLGSERPLIEIGSLVSLPAVAVLCLHQPHRTQTGQRPGREKV